MSQPNASSDIEETLQYFQPALRTWFQEVFPAPTAAQMAAWPAIARGEHTLLLAPTGSGKTLAAFLVAIDRIMFDQRLVLRDKGVRVLYISPLKALGVDVQRNLRAPIAGVRVVAERENIPYHLPRIGVRSGDTPTEDRRKMIKEPPEILITTPESLYLLLTSRAREILTTVDTVIIDEIHSMVSTKRGAHLFFSLERLVDLRRRRLGDVAGIQRIGLSATQRPLEEVARLLGGAEAPANHDLPPVPRPVTVVEAGRRKQLQLRIEVPVEDMAHMGEPVDRSGPAAAGLGLPSIWPAIHPRLVELIRAHRTTMLFVNSRRLAERLAAAINELAKEEIALAHHGSIAKDTRVAIEDRLKRGELPAIVATSSLELGIDMGAVDLVVQIEAPPSIASGIQRVGRSGHQVGAPSTGIIFPKYRGDLLACTAAVRRMHDGEVEETFYPRNPLDVLAQQIVAMAAMETCTFDALYRVARGSAPFADLPRSAFEGILDLLSGRYPSSEFNELRPRVNWDRISGEVSSRRGAQRLAITNAGTIPDRGLYGVFLLGTEEQPGSRVGELDEEMVFETRAGDVFLLGASSWRVLDITHDRVIVEPAPGEPGKMPFWRGDGPGRPLEFGRAIGELSRILASQPPHIARQRLIDEHGVDHRAADNLLQYLHDQIDATGELPSDRTIVVESFRDEVGDWRTVVMTPFGSRVHAPWAMAVVAKLREEGHTDIDHIWNDDGMVFRVPDSDLPPTAELFFPHPDEVEEIVVQELGGTSLFAARFRENSARALLLPRQQPGRRTPLWLQRRKAADLLKVATRYEKFPLTLETYRECLRDVFDIVGLKAILRDVALRTTAVHRVTTSAPSPFAGTLMYNYTANFLYNGDAPLAERRAATLALDHTQLRELLGSADIRELLVPEVVDELALELQRLEDRYLARDADELHDLLLRLGDLTFDEIVARCRVDEGSDEKRSSVTQWLASLRATSRIAEVRIGGRSRHIAAEDAGRYRDALGIAPPLGLPDSFLEETHEPLEDLVGRYARTHVPFVAEAIAARWGIGMAAVRKALVRLASGAKVVEGEFLPGGRGREWCDLDVLRTLKQRSLSHLRKAIEPAAAEAWSQFSIRWHGIDRPRRGLDAVLDVVQQLQGLPLPANDWETAILPARVMDYNEGDLDELCAAGEIVWQGEESLGANNGRIALYLTDQAARLTSPRPSPTDPMELTIHDLLNRQGALFFKDIVESLQEYRVDVLQAIWRLVWSGHITNDTLQPLRSMWSERRDTRSRTNRRPTSFRSRRTQAAAGAEGRWSLLRAAQEETVTATERQLNVATQLIERYGIVTRELVLSEPIAGGYASLYPVYKAMEESGRVRRGYFIAGQGAAQFAVPGAEDRLRDLGKSPAKNANEVVVIAATDPASPYGAALRWPTNSATSRVQRQAGARVILWEGRLIGYLGKSQRKLTTFLPEREPDRHHALSALFHAFARLAKPGHSVLISNVDGQDVAHSPLAHEFKKHGFQEFRNGYLLRAAKED